MRPRTAILLFGCAILGLTTWLVRPSLRARASGPFPQSTYIWQRLWTPEVSHSVATRAHAFRTLYVLAGEHEVRRGTWAGVDIHPDWSSIPKGSRVGLVYRLVASPGEPPLDSALADVIVARCDAQAGEASAAGLAIAEVQIDYDCPTSKLGRYEVFLRDLRKGLPPETRLSITALATWLDAPEFRAVAEATDHYVLQVHALQRPGTTAATICDPAKAHRWVEQAGRLGHPFEVALPTYGYLLAIDGVGQVLAIGAEQARADGRVLELRADAEAMSGLVREWRVDRPESMTGLVWFRLPTEQDALNWPWPTLEAVMAGRVPEAQLRVETRTDADGLTWIIASNEGDGEAKAPAAMILDLREGRVVVAEALRGFQLDRLPDGRLRWSPMQDVTGLGISPGEQRPVGWLRLETPEEVVLHVEN